MSFDPDVVKRALTTARWAALARTDASVAEIARWDPSLLRQTRVLVPIDVQALYVPEGDASLFVKLPFALTTRDGQPPETMPGPFAPGVVRAPGVHLHWAPPDALLNGTLQPRPDASRNRLGLPALPDRWVVLRLCVPRGATAPHVTGWVIEADTAKAVPLDQWPAGSPGAVQAGKTLTKTELTGSAGGTLNWVGVYDAVTNRLAFHDPLSDLATVAPQGVIDDLAAYVVAGWWSDPELDPLDDAETRASLHTRLEQLRWRVLEDAEGGDQLGVARSLDAARRGTLGLQSGSRYPSGLEGAHAIGTRAVADQEARLKDVANPIRPYQTTASRFVDQASKVVTTEPRWPRSTLLHGSVHGVPVRGPVVADLRPSGAAVEVAVGLHGDDLAAAFASTGMGAATADQRRATERILAAFAGQVLRGLGTADGVVDAEEHEHEAAFLARPGGPGVVERVRTGATAGPLAAGRAARGVQARSGLGTGVKAGGGKTGGVSGTLKDPGTTFTWLGTRRTDLYKGTIQQQRDVVQQWGGARPDREPVSEVREVVRPAPSFHEPLEPMIAVRSPKRSRRHRVLNRFSADGFLQCRWPSQVPTKVQGVVDGRDVLASLPSGAIPPEVLLLARSAIVTDPYLVPWLAENEARRRRADPKLFHNRLAAEAVMRFGARGVYDGGTDAFTPAGTRAPRASADVTRVQVADGLRRFSLLEGADCDPVGVTAWAQPWVPLWIEWEVEVRASDRVDGWKLGQVDLDPVEELPVAPRTFRGRTPLHAGTARTLAGAIQEWLTAERQRDHDNQGEADDATADALARVAATIQAIDIVTASLDSLHDQLLGLPVGPDGLLHARRPDDTIDPPVPTGPPQLLRAGRLTLTRVRLVDAFGRTLDVPAAGVLVPARDEIAGPPRHLRLRPRLTVPARWLLRLVDPAIPDSLVVPTEPAEATIDQIDPSRMVNPVAGFLLPDHIDEALEVFDATGQPIGQLMHEPFGGGVMWEIAPGREGPPDAPPLHGLPPAARHLGLLASAMVAVDAQTRQAKAADDSSESALSAFLRAVDTTLWTVDTFASLGSEHIAGLVGRPIAVVRATLRLDIDDDLDEVNLTDPARRAERETAYRALADRAFEVRIGELTRSDDGVLGFFVDDDYRKLHVVDKVVRALALDVGRGRGHLAQLGDTRRVPDVKPITHPYVIAEDTLSIHPGQKVTLTLLMHPGGRVHLTSGILPRKDLQLARDWAQPGLAVIAPSVRVGPVLIDADKVRLPKISSFPKDQIWTRRDTPFTWKNDPILAATQTALLPALPSSVEEGYIRVAPAALAAEQEES